MDLTNSRLFLTQIKTWLKQGLLLLFDQVTLKLILYLININNVNINLNNYRTSSLLFSLGGHIIYNMVDDISRQWNRQIKCYLSVLCESSL